MVDDERLRKLLLHLYDCAIHGQWPEFLEQLRRALDVPRELSTPSAINEEHLGVAAAWFGVDPEAIRPYAERLGALDAWARTARERGSVVSDTRRAGVVGEYMRGCEHLRTPFFDEFGIDRDDTETPAALASSTEASSSIPLPHQPDDRPFDQLVLEVLQLLAPHLHLALTIQARMHLLEHHEQLPSEAVLPASLRSRVLNPDVVRRTLGLTPTEARIATALATGRTVQEISRDLGVNAATIRWHLKRVYAKTGTGSQLRLVALVHQITSRG